MTMISHTAARVPVRTRRWPGPAFVHARALLILIWEAFTEGQEMSRAANQRYPFADW